MPTVPAPATLAGRAVVPRWRFPAVRRLVAIGDIHGTVSALRTALRLAGVLHPRRDEWVGGDTVLVQTGDLLDRGDTEVAVLRLLTHLQDTAGASGGAVHLLLGNHEEDAVNRPAHVVRPATCAAWDVAYPHLAGPRDSVGGSGDSGGSRGRRRFRFGSDATAHRQRCIPAGTGWTAQPYQLARHRALAPGGPMAAALAPRLRVAIVIGDTLFVHGSLTAAMLREQLNVQNGGSGDGVGGIEKQLNARSADALVAAMNVRLRRHLAGELTYPPEASQYERLEAFPAVQDRTFSTPLWRGDRGEAADLTAVLDLLRVRRMVVGHTIHERITARYGGRVWCIDTGMFRQRGRVEVLEIGEPGRVSVLSAEGRRRGMTVAEGGEHAAVYLGDGYEEEYGEL
ncbi:hypothetical protein MMPV_007461 [Pyropia vietnamensis]